MERFFICQTGLPGMIRHLLLQKYRAQEKGELNHGQEQLKITPKDPFL
jgi:hypothetical protein